jgi:hypothetical protein
VVTAVGVVCFALPINRLSPGWQAAALLTAMVTVAATVALAARDVLRLLVDVTLIIDEIAGRLRHVAVPATAFLLLYVLLVVTFASAYRIADGLSRHPLFAEGDHPAWLTYSAALHFSVATLSTVGYGDIRPQDDGVRVLASVQVVAGQLLLLFGVAEILRSRRARRVDRREGAEGNLDGDGSPEVSPDDRGAHGHGDARASPRHRRNPPPSEDPI